MIGTTVGHYRVLSLLGRGSMGEVYAAEDTRLGRRVALKVLTDRSADHSELASEAKVVASLDHANIAAVYELGEHEGRVFIAMELIEGPTLADVLRDGPLAPDRTAALLGKIAAGMAHAHARGVIHRDLKPANIMLTADGEPKIMDFGLAVQRNERGEFDADEFGGTLAYIAPEQIQGAAPDQQTDIWSLGVVCYEMLTGRRPFAGDYSAALLYAIAHATPAAVRETAPDAAYLEPVVRRLLARDRSERFPAMDAVHEAATSVRADAAPETGGRRWLVPTLAGAVVVVLVGAATWFVQGRDLPGTGDAPAPSVAVMPLQCALADSALADFALGFSGEVIAELAQVRDLHVIAQSSSCLLSGQQLSTAEIADRLGVATVVEGTVRQVGPNLRIATRLRDARDDRILWAESYDAAPSNALILQASIARAVATRLKGGLSAREEARLTEDRTIDPEAYRAYLKAIAMRARWGSVKNWIATEGVLLQVVTAEPDFAPAWAELGRVYHFLRWFITDESLMYPQQPEFADHAREQNAAVAALLGLGPDAQYLELTRAAAARALALDPGLGTAHTVHGMNLWGYDQDWDGARTAFTRAIDLAPGDDFVRRWYANFLELDGECDEAIRQARIGVEHSPLALDNRRELLGILANCRRFDAARAYIQEIAPIYVGQPDDYLLWYALFEIALAEGDDATMAAAKDSLAARTSEWIAAPYHWLHGRKELAWRMSGPPRGARSNSKVLQLLALEGRYDEAIAILDTIVTERPPYGMVMMVDPVLDVLHDDPRWDALCRRVRLPGYRD